MTGTDKVNAAPRVADARAAIAEIDALEALPLNGGDNAG